MMERHYDWAINLSFEQFVKQILFEVIGMSFTTAI